MSDEINEVITPSEEVIVVDSSVPGVTVVEEEILPATEVADIIPTPDALEVLPAEAEVVKEETAI